MKSGVKRSGGFFFAFFVGAEMKTLVPQNFLRVADKFYPRFIDLDREVGLGASHLYAFLFVSSLHTGECSVPMETLALVCKGCERTARTYLGILRHYEYIDVRRDWTSSNGRSVYRLLRSPRLMSLLERLGYETDSLFLSEDRKNVPVGAAKSAGPSYKEDKKEEKRDITPLSPLPTTSTGDVPPSRRVSAPAQTRACATGGVCPPKLSGRGDFLSRPKRAETPEGRSLAQRSRIYSMKAGTKRSADGAVGTTSPASLPAAFVRLCFERLFQAWPIKQGKLSAERTFYSLARAGRLPDIDALLGVVERFKSCDSRWKRGYVPNLTGWLQGERWNDEPFRQDGYGAACGVDASSGMQAVPLAPPAKELPTAKLAPEERAKADEAGTVFDAFSRLWPSEARGRICAALCRARARGFSPEKLLDRARESMAGAMPPPSFDAWLEGVYA